jgi:hypothetical protein
VLLYSTSDESIPMSWSIRSSPSDATSNPAPWPATVRSTSCAELHFTA